MMQTWAEEEERRGESLPLPRRRGEPQHATVQGCVGMESSGSTGPQPRWEHPTTKPTNPWRRGRG